MGFDLGKAISDAGNTIKDAAKAVAPAVAATVVGPAALILYDHKVSQAAGRAVGAASAAVDRGADFVAKTVQQIPILGPVYHAQMVLYSRPFAVAEHILRGENVSQSAVEGLKQAMGAVREEAPMAQAIVSLVPAVGPLASSAIGAGLALASGAPMDEVAMAAVAGAIPGGALAKAAYNVGRAAIVQHRVGDLAAMVTAIGAAAGVSVPPAAATALTGGLHTLQAVANGQKPDAAIMGAALQALPAAKGINLSSGAGAQQAADGLIGRGIELLNLSPQQQKFVGDALKIGIAVQHASDLQKLQAADAAHPAATTKLQAVGQQTLDPVSQSALDSLRSSGANGFLAGHGLMQHRTTGAQIAAARKTLGPADQRGFDVSTALHLGRVVAPPMRAATPAARAGYAVTMGATLGAHPSSRAVVAAVTGTPEGAAGAKLAQKALDRWGWLDAAVVVGGLALGASIGGVVGAVAGAVLGGALDLLRRRDGRF